MGSSISGILAESFLQYYEQLTLKHVLETKAIINYNSYVPDNLFITEQQIMNAMNNIHLNMQFSLTYQNSNCLDYPDLLSIKKGHKQEIDIYRKPTTTGTLYIVPLITLLNIN
jgi:hypothetical protein